MFVCTIGDLLHFGIDHNDSHWNAQCAALEHSTPYNTGGFTREYLDEPLSVGQTEEGRATVDAFMREHGVEEILIIWP